MVVVFVWFCSEKDVCQKKAFIQSIDPVVVVISTIELPKQTQVLWWMSAQHERNLLPGMVRFKWSRYCLCLPAAHKSSQNTQIAHKKLLILIWSMLHTTTWSLLILQPLGVSHCDDEVPNRLHAACCGPTKCNALCLEFSEQAPNPDQGTRCELAELP